MATDDTKEKGKRVTFEWSAEETAALDTISKREPFITLGSSRRAIVRYVLLMHAQETAALPATKADAAEIMSLMKGLALVARAAPAAEAPQKRGPKPKEGSSVLAEEKVEQGENICMALGGSVSGMTCVYKKYEVMATGRPVSFDTSEPLASLTEAAITNQFDPSREGYERAVAEWKEGE